MQLKKIILAGVLAPGLAMANTLTHLSGSQFTDGLVTIQYPCTAGGEPLVIYSTVTRNTTPLSSSSPILPVYVKQGYRADPLMVSRLSQNSETATDRLIIQSMNPANHDQLVSFGLRRPQAFFVNSINFAAIDAADDARIVSSFKISMDNDYYQTIVPSKMYNFVQDMGFFVFRNVHEIKGEQYTWSQQGLWRDQNGMQPNHLIKYFFQPIKPPGSNTFNGFGFWICGKDNTSAGSVTQLRKTAYIDKIKGSK